MKTFGRADCLLLAVLGVPEIIQVEAGLMGTSVGRSPTTVTLGGPGQRTGF